MKNGTSRWQFDVIGPHNLIRCGTFRGHDFVGGSMLLWGQDLRFLMIRTLPSVSVNVLLLEK